MKHVYVVLFVLIFIILSCKKHSSVELDTTKDTYHDAIADITYINDHFYTTNYDVSGNAGPQINLLKFSSDGKNIDDSFNLGMNGQGYFAITNDGRDIYLQSRQFYTIIQSSLVGEKGYLKWDSISFSQWQPSGICCVNNIDSLILLYRNNNNPIQYRARTVSKQNPVVVGRDLIFQLDSVSTTDDGIYAITYKDSSFYMLGVNQSHKDILVITNYNFSISSIEDIPDATVVGLCFKGNDLYMSYRDRRIERWASY